MVTDKFAALVAAANRGLTNRHTNRDVPAPGESTAPANPRFELYHAAPSLCSYKVRFVLAEKGQAFRSHALTIIPTGRNIPDNYRPDYVRLRLAGAPDATLVEGYTGRSSVETEGFDPAVVPTLVDHEARRIIVDSARICEYVDQEAGDPSSLRPAEHSEAIDALIAIVDRAPHVALLYGANPSADHRPGLLARLIKGVHARKEVALRKMMATIPDDAELLAAYESKIAKERAAAEFIGTKESMGTIVGQMRDGVVEFETHLAKHGGDWACGDRFTLADIAWAPSLFRMKWIGIGHLFSTDSECPHVAGYADRVFARPAFRDMVQWWPGAHPPSPYMPEFNTLGYKAGFVWRTLSGRV